MGITLNQLDQFAGGAVEGYTGSQANRRFNAKNEREQAAEDRTALDYKNLQDANALEVERVERIAMQEAYQQTNNSSMQDRARIDEKWAATGQQGPSGPAMYGAPNVSVAATPGAPNIPAPTVPQLAGDVGALPEVPMAKAADGGPVEMGPPAQGLPVQQPPQQQPPQQQPPQQQPPAQGLPVEPEQPAYKTRRQEYQAWYKKASAAHAKAGGLKGLQAFRDQENALSRKQMLGYGTKGVAAMRDGNAGDAVRQLNTMLDVSPEDSGMRWEAFDGKVYLVGSDGNKGNPYDQAAVMSLIENKIKTPENYLAFQKEAREQGMADEDVRASKEDERQARREQTETERGALIEEEETMKHHVEQETVAATNAESISRQVTVLEKKLPSHIAKEGAYIYKLLKDADSNEIRAIQAAKQAELGWDDNAKLKINNDLPSLMQNAKLDAGMKWMAPMMDDPGMALVMQSGMVDIMLENHKDNVNYPDAIGLGALAYSGLAGINLPPGTVLPKVGQRDGKWIVDYNGKEIIVPEHIARALRLTKSQAASD